MLSGAFAFVLLLIPFNAYVSPTSLTSSSAGSPAGSSSSSGQQAPSGGSGGSVVETVVAARSLTVVDGDTFVLSSGDRVRVLGIDSCEMSTDRGPDAKSAALTFLAGSRVTLTTEPGVDRDQYGRMLRYVSTDDGDMGEWMVTGEHTAVYGGRSDASADRLQRLRAEDGNGRSCDDPESSAESQPDPAPKPRSSPSTSDDDESGAGPSAPERSGNSGHLCLPGERDGDGDGYCGER